MGRAGVGGCFKRETKFVYIITFVLILSDNKQTGIQLLPVPLLLARKHLHVDQYSDPRRRLVRKNRTLY